MFGIQVNGATGRLEPMTGCTTVGCGATDVFEVSCVLTAHQTDAMNATAEINVKASRFAYPDPLVIVRPGRTHTSPIVSIDANSAKMFCIPSDATKWLTLRASDGRVTASSPGSSAYNGVGGIMGTHG